MATRQTKIGSPVNSVAVGDFNADGLQDFAAATNTGIRVLERTCGLVCVPSNESFENVNGLPAAGWSFQNNSEPTGTPSAWFQGNAATYPSQSGQPNSYISANFNSGAGVATISNWLLTPVMDLRNGATISFYTRTVAVPTFPDRLQVRMSTAGNSTVVGVTPTDIGDFHTLLLDINPTYSPSGYPSDWTQFTATISGLSSPTAGRFAFRYFVENGGPNGVNSDTVGIDTLSYALACDPSPTPTATATSPCGGFNLGCGTPTSTPTFKATETPTGSPITTPTPASPSNTATATPTGTPGTTCNETFDGISAPALPAAFASTASGSQSQWVTSTFWTDTAPNAASAPNPGSIGNSDLVSRPFSIPASGGSFSFKNNYITEPTYDGMVLEISIAGGAFQDILTSGGSFISGGYNSTISSSHLSPIAGRLAWSGNSNGFITTTVMLPLTASGANIQLKWRMATDNSVPATGVRIDTITGIPCASASPTPVYRAPFDYVGDVKSDLSFFRPSTNTWHIRDIQTGNTFVVPNPGIATDRLAPADYDNDLKTNVASYNPSTGSWSVRKSIADPTLVPLGPIANSNPNDLIVPADGDRDGKADITVFRPSIGRTVRQNTGNRGTDTSNIFAQIGDIPTIGDFDGDGRADSAVFRLSDGTSYRIDSANGLQAVPLGTPTNPTDIPVPGDYDGDGRTNIAVYRPSEGKWLVNRPSIGLSTYPFGRPGNARDIPCPGDYDGNEESDLCIFSPVQGIWYLWYNPSTNPPPGSTGTGTDSPDATTGSFPSGTVTFTFGADGDIPTPSAFLYAGAPGQALINGTVTYGNAIGNPPPPRFVSNVLISGAGLPAVSTTSFTSGAYSLSGFGSGSYMVIPSKTGGVNGITSFDAARISQHIVGPPILNVTQLIVADVSGNGAVSSFDAGQIAKYVAGEPFAPPGIGSTATWKFTPANRNYASVTGSIVGENYSALLMGEVSGNWTSTGARPVGRRQLTARGGPERGTSVTAPNLVTPKGAEIVIPISVKGVVGKGVISYEFDLRYDPSVIRPHSDPVELAGTVSRGLSAVANTSVEGILRVVVYGPIPIRRNGILLNLRFSAVGVAGSVSPVVWERVLFNEGEPAVRALDGQVELIDGKQ
ncbi:MAG: choice-of-anchor J domain-containing protein [Pyrinomonadaceae bacterium]